MNPENKIKKLDAAISNKIAAGEVVERPAAVVKELVENAIDAGSTAITVEIKTGGREFIRITDNGSGIRQEDVLLAFERHATSKISEVSDIYSIASLGFRGEALASISAVSNVELVTKREEDELGYKVNLSGGRLVSEENVGCPGGTTIVVADLFFNTPARLKFLKSDTTEQNQINNIVNKLALSHPEIAFKYIVDNKNIFVTNGKNKVGDGIWNIYGKATYKNLVEVDFQDPSMSVKGYASNINFTRGNKQLQIVFVNGRYVKSPVIAEALSLAYKGLIPINRHPLCFLFIEVAPTAVDVNIHPAKTEIKFHEEAKVKQAIYANLRSLLNSYVQTPKAKLDDDKFFRKVVFDGEPPDALEQVGFYGKTASKRPVGSGAEPKYSTKASTEPKVSMESSVAQKRPIDPQRDSVGKEAKVVEPSLKAAIEQSSQTVEPKQTEPKSESKPEPKSSEPAGKSDRPSDPDQLFGDYEQDIEATFRSTVSDEKSMTNDFKKTATSADSHNKTYEIEEVFARSDEKVAEGAFVRPVQTANENTFARPEKKVEQNPEQDVFMRPERKEETAVFEKPEVEVEEDIFIRPEEKPEEDFVVKERLMPSQTLYDDFRYVGQMFKTYLIFEKDDRMYMMDQHAAHEKIMYEHFMEAFRAKKVTSQILLDAIPVDLTYEDKKLALDNEELFRSIGLYLEDFGPNGLIIREIPAQFDMKSAKALFMDLIENISGIEGDQYIMDEEAIIQHSCKSAIKAHMNLDAMEVTALISQLKQLKEPYTCPHGRPILIEISKFEIEKKFKRK